MMQSAIYVFVSFLVFFIPLILIVGSLLAMLAVAAVCASAREERRQPDAPAQTLAPGLSEIEVWYAGQEQRTPRRRFHLPAFIRH